MVSNYKFFAHFEKWATHVISAIPITLLNDGSISQETQLGAIGDIQFTLRVKNIEEDIIVIAGDNYMTYPLLEQYHFFKQKNADTLCAKKIADRKQLTGLAVATLDENGKVLSLVEKPQDPPSDTAIYATYIYRADTLPLFARYLQDERNNRDAPGHFPQWLHKEKDVYAYVMNGDCHDLGTVDVYEQMQAMLAKQKETKP